jgi:F-type H+-transporting ATPase subunit a
MIKKRHILLLCVILMIVLGSVVAFTKPVLPVIQLPGEIYPGTEGIPVINGITNTFVAALLAWLIVLGLGLSLRARSRTADEVPTGFYNLFEAIIEGAFKFAANMGGTKKAKDFFPIFITLVLYILTANWMELIPGVDSIGIWEHLPHIKAVRAADAAVDEGMLVAGSEAYNDYLHDVEHEIDLENVGDFRTGPLNALLIRAEGRNVVEGKIDPVDHRIGRDPTTADWTIVPLVRAAATDLNFTLALSLVTMFMVQYYGFKYLGGGYLKKFFPIDVAAMSKNPIKAIDPAVGLLELIGEISRIISFAFRLLGNIFAGQILLFVMAFLLPVANVVFFGLEFFVGLIQAAVFGLLGLIFMTGATESHHDDHDEHH